MTFATWLIDKRGPESTLVLGLDPLPAVLNAWGEEDSLEGLSRWSRALTEHVLGLRIECIKVQVAFFERRGVSGLAVLRDLMQNLRKEGVFVIGDAKRGDIGSTMEGYASAWLEPGSDFEVDSLTLNPYLGFESLEPALTLAETLGKGIFVLSATSNPEARLLQASTGSTGLSVARSVVESVYDWRHKHEGSALGVVLGATVDRKTLGLPVELDPLLPLLVPGYGAQGASLGDVQDQFPGQESVLPVVARSVLLAGSAGFTEAWSSSVRELRGL